MRNASHEPTPCPHTLRRGHRGRHRTRRNLALTGGGHDPDGDHASPRRTSPGSQHSSRRWSPRSRSRTANVGGRRQARRRCGRNRSPSPGDVQLTAPVRRYAVAATTLEPADPLVPTEWWRAAIDADGVVAPGPGRTGHRRRLRCRSRPSGVRRSPRSACAQPAGACPLRRRARHDGHVGDRCAEQRCRHGR